MRKLLAAAAILGAFAASPLSAATYLAIPQVAGATGGTYATAINDDDMIAGMYFDATGSHGFVGTLDGRYTTFDTGTGPTLVYGIDKAGDVVGYNSEALSPGCTSQPFERSAGGRIKPIKMDGTAMNGATGGMDAEGEFVGFYCNGNTAIGYLGRKAKHVEDFQISGVHPFLVPGGINAAHTIAGTTSELSGTIEGFVLKDGTTTIVAYPGASQTDLYGLNDKGVAGGSYSVGSGLPHAFLYDIGTRRFQAVEPPGVARSVVVSINNAGLAVLSTDLGPFLYCPKKPAKCPTAPAR